MLDLLRRYLNIIYIRLIYLKKSHLYSTHSYLFNQSDYHTYIVPWSIQTMLNYAVVDDFW